MTSFDKAWRMMKESGWIGDPSSEWTDYNEIPDDEWEEGYLGFTCPDCGHRHDNHGVCDDCWEVKRHIDQKGGEYGTLPPHLHDTPLHEEGKEQMFGGLSVDWEDGNVKGEMSMPLYNLYDHYDRDTGQPI